MSLSRSLEDYLEMILILNLQKEEVRVKELVQSLNVKNSSVISALNKLEEKKLIQHEKYGGIYFTKEGFKMAANIYARHRLLSDFLSKILDIPMNETIFIACELEHIFKGKNLEKIKKLLLFFENNPELLNKLHSFIPDRTIEKIPEGREFILYEANMDHEYIFVRSKDTRIPLKQGQLLRVENISPRKNIFEIYSSGNYYYFSRDESLAIILKEKK